MRRASALAVMGAKTQPERWKAIRAFYQEVDAEIRAVDVHEWGIDPYEVDWSVLFTPIERGLWYDVRATGAVLYPQYPIGPYFADFANPNAMVVIECDGVQFHKDKAKDKKRDAYMQSLGWRVHRLDGRDCFDCGEVVHEETGETFYTESVGEKLLLGLGLSRRSYQGRHGRD